MNTHISEKSTLPDDVKSRLYPETVSRSDYMSIFWQWFPLIFFWFDVFCNDRMSGGWWGTLQYWEIKSSSF
ncbi:MAG: hypothetical protein IPH28_14095 [Cytophagaceae bacterium]|nr:hypothetical protein [Cytophagaceae bacterium]